MLKTIKAPQRKAISSRPFADVTPGESVYQNMPNFESAETVPRISVEAPQHEHVHRYLRRHEPVLVQSELLRQNVVTQKWPDLDYLKEKAGDELVTITQGVLLDGPTTEKEMTFGAYIDAIDERSRGDKQMYMRLKSVPSGLEEDTHELIDVLRQLSGKSQSIFQKRDIEWNKRKPFTSAFIGRHTYTDSHEHGGHEAFLFQATGTKEVLLHRPTDQNYESLYIDSRWSPVRFFQSNLDKYPLFRNNQPVYTKVHAGEILYIPDGWYHSVASFNDGLSATLTHFFPATHYDVSDASTWKRFQQIQQHGTEKQREMLYARMVAEPQLLASYAERRFTSKA
jgi:hypothetical protein